MNKGWRGESERHRLASYGIKTGRKDYGKKYTYFYSNKVKTIKPKNNGFAVQKFVVYKVPETNKDAELQARTIAKKRKDTLAGGLFHENSKPYNFKENYKVVDVPASTPESKPTAHDRFIDNIIAYESGEATPEQEKKSNSWHYEKDAYGDPSWDINKDGAYYELRVYPNKENWSAILVKFESKDLFAKKINQRTLSKGEKEEVIKYAEKYVKG